MSRYFLSYVEVNDGHGALMLAVQESHANPSAIVAQIGFAYSPNSKNDDVGNFSTHSGDVREENDNLAKFLYGRSKITHRTYEITKSEAEKFFHIINRDRNVNVIEVEHKSDIGEGYKTAHGGPSYQRVSMNCKAYAIGVMKELGIADVDCLSNFFVQIPGSTSSLMLPVKKSEISCPLKEKFIGDVAGLINKCLSFSEYLKNEKIIDEGEFASFSEKIKNVRDNAYRAGFDVSLNGKIESMAIDIISFFEKAKKNYFKHSRDDSGSDALKTRIDEAESFEEEFNGLLRKIEEISQKTHGESLEFFWNDAPPLSKRARFSEMTEIEKSTWLVQEKTHSSIAAVKSMTAILNDHVSSHFLEDEENIQISRVLREMLLLDKALQEKAREFHEKIENRAEEKVDILFCCDEYNKEIGDEISRFMTALSGVGIDRDKGSGVVFDLLKNVFNTLGKDYILPSEKSHLVEGPSLFGHRESLSKASVPLSSVPHEKSPSKTGRPGA